jgi:hypothetical protein
MRFSGEIAKKINKSGDGIGMWRIKQMLEPIVVKN